MMPERHVEEVDSVRLGMVVERIEIERRFPETSFVEVFVASERLISQFQLAEDRVLSGQEGGDRNERRRNEIKQRFTGMANDQQAKEQAADRASAGNSFAAANAAKNPVAANRQPESNRSSQMRRKE